MTKNYFRVYDVVRKIPKGKVLTYGRIGKLLNLNPRVVGNILHQNPDEKNIPCHRVVNARGRLAPGFAFDGPDGQKKRLEAEGVKITADRVDLAKFLWEDYIKLKKEKV